MGDLWESFKSSAKALLFNKKNLINLLVLSILILAIPVGLRILQERQIIKSRAVADPVVPTGKDVSKKQDGKWTSKQAKVTLELTSPLGPPGEVSRINLLPPQINVKVPCLPKETSEGELARITWVNPSTPVKEVIIREVNNPKRKGTYSNGVSGPGDTSVPVPEGFNDKDGKRMNLLPDQVYSVSLVGDMEGPPSTFTIPICTRST